jgi:hypothetical protein
MIGRRKRGRYGSSFALSPIAVFSRLAIAIFAGRGPVGTRALLLLAAQQIATQLGRETSILVRAAKNAFMPGTSGMAAMGFGI